MKVINYLVFFGLAYRIASEQDAEKDLQIDNFATWQYKPTDGSTALVPQPSQEFLSWDARYPFLAPLPKDWSFKMTNKWPNCAWQVATEPSASSFGLLDLNAYYHTLVIWDFKDSDVYRIKGQFPATRYFSFQTYEFSNGKPIASMLDLNIIPKTGKNPHADPSAAPEQRGTYEIYFTPKGDNGYPNEVRVKRPGQKVDIVTIIYRIYDKDPSITPEQMQNTTRKQQFWGFADPAVVEKLISHEKNIWEEYAPCSDFGSALFQSSFTDLYPVFRHFPATPASCPMAQLSDDLFPSMILFGGGLEQGYAASITSYTNYDTRYLYWCAQKSRTGPNIVVRIQGKLPRVPHSLYQHPKVSEVDSYDARYISISTIDMLYPSPTYQEYKDHDIEWFYSQIPEWDRTYSIVFAIDKSVAASCKLFDPNSQLFLAWNDTYHYGLEPTRMPSIVYRELLPNNARGKSLQQVHDACINDKNKCGDGDFIRSIMQETYPQIDIWDCDPHSGVATYLK